MTEDLKFCKDCKHYQEVVAIGTPWGGGIAFPESCCHPGNISKPNLVKGTTYWMADPTDLRRPEGNCGEDGKWFEAAPPKPPEPVPELKPRDAYVLIAPPDPEPRGFWSRLFGL